MADDAPQSAEEMAASLAEYKEQLAQVEALLAADPANAEFLDVKASLEEVIALTEDLVATAAAPPPSAPPPPPPPPPAPAPESAAHFAALDTSVDGAACQVRRGGEAGGVWVDAVMRGALHDGRIRVTLVRGGGDGDDDDAAPPGASSEHIDVAPEDVRAAPDPEPSPDDPAARIAAAPLDGARRDDLRGGDDADDARRPDHHPSSEADAAAGTTLEAGDHLRGPSAAGADDAETYRGVPAPKRLKVMGDVTEFRARELPKKLAIDPGDDAATRERKRKQIKAFKGKERMREKDAEQNAKRSDWQSFQAKVGGKKKTGFMSKKIGDKAKSMFSNR